MIDFFILGNPRSGTTLLRLMLNAHSELVVPPEAGFAVWLLNSWKNDIPYNNEVFVKELLKTNKIENWNLDPENLLYYLESKKARCLTSAINLVYKYYSEKCNANIALIGDKNNYFIHHIPELRELSPNAKFIHIVRDGRDVACSYRNVMSKKINSKYAPKLPIGMKEIAEEWSENNRGIRTELRNSDHILVRLEDLTANPELELSGICEFLNVKYEGRMLDYYKMEENSFEPKEYDQWKLKNKQPIFNEVDAYKDSLLVVEIKEFEKYAKDELLEYKYRVE